MLKYENMINNDNSDAPKDDGAYRITKLYGIMCPDIIYYYKKDWHRIDGPAFIDLQVNYVSFYIHGKNYDSTKEFCNKAGMSDEDTLMWVLKYGDSLPYAIEDFYGADWRSIPMHQL